MGLDHTLEEGFKEVLPDVGFSSSSGPSLKDIPIVAF